MQPEHLTGHLEPIHPSFFDQFTDWLLEEEIAFSMLQWAETPFPVIGVLTANDRQLAIHMIDIAGWQRIESEVPSDFFKDLDRDKKGLQIVHLWEDVWQTKKSIVKSRIAAMVGSFGVIPGRLTKVRRIDRQAAYAFLENNHLQNPVVAKYRYGLFLPGRYYRVLNGEERMEQSEEMLVAVGTFSQARNFMRAGQLSRSYELVRFASLLNYRVAGGLDKIVKAFTREHTVGDIMTYADLDWSAGDSYSRLGFTRMGNTEPLQIVLDLTTGARHYPGRHNVLDESAGELVKIYNSGSSKWVKVFPAPLPADNPPGPQKTDPVSFIHPPLIFILGPTASGKTHLAAHLASRLGAEIVSADSRQVYRDMDIGTGKDLDEFVVGDRKIRYHLIDIVNPGEQYNVHRFQQDFFRVLEEIQDRHLPIIVCGGSGLYIESVIKGYTFGIEEPGETQKPLMACHVFGINPPVLLRRRKISDRLEIRLRNGLIEEVSQLLARGITSDQLIFFGLEYKYITQFLKNELTYEEMFRRLETDIHRFAKRQMTFFRKMERGGIDIHWLDPSHSVEEMIDEILKIATDIKPVPGQA